MREPLRVTIITGTSAALSDLLCVRMRALGVPVARYRHEDGTLLRSHDGERTSVPVDHCASCALRADLPDFLTGLPGGRLMLVLPETADPLDAAIASEGAGATVETVAMIVDLGSVADALAGAETLAERGLAAGVTDHRTLAGLLARQAETADVFLTWTGSDADPDQVGLGRALLTHLSPGAGFTDIDAAADRIGVDAGKAFDLQAVLERTQPGGALPGCPAAFGRVSTLIWRSRRPFHPERLYAALDRVMNTGVRRARGHLWLASRPLTLLSWQIAGATLSIEPAGRWLHAAGPDEWQRVSPIRRTAACLDWHPEHGDRRSEIRFTGTDLLDRELCSVLDEAVLTGPEMAFGERAWARLADPFTPWLGPTARAC
ncbi:GTP-binding protein [Actinoallomurus sp. NPDC052274]|uniref:GTP-binding protein n=1 Tax=Actinoallomurus sp. NPDC052274 TaxID=3155420 RepID=UPI003434DDBC